jgi:hypothetical protein
VLDDGVAAGCRDDAREVAGFGGSTGAAARDSAADRRGFAAGAVAEFAGTGVVVPLAGAFAAGASFGVVAASDLGGCTRAVADPLVSLGGVATSLFCVSGSAGRRAGR